MTQLTEAHYTDSVSQAAALLGTIFYQDPASEKGKAAFSWFAAKGNQEVWEFGQPRAKDVIELMQSAWSEKDVCAQAIHEEYNRLFIGPHRLPAPPWASVYTDPEAVIFGNATLGVRQWMRDNAVKLTLSDKEPEDHFGLILMMLSWGISHGVSVEALDELLEKHLLTWAFYFLQLFEKGAKHPLYKQAAHLAALTLTDWRDRFALNPPTVNLHHRA